MATFPTPPGPQATPYFLRRWQIQLATPAGTYTLTNSQFESLRVEFSIEMYMLLAYWQATITIYNLSAAIASQIQQSSPSLVNPWLFGTPINTGDSISISGGYQYASSGAFNPTAELLFSGRVFQSMWTRENVTDYKLTLRCITGLIEDAYNFTSVSVAPGTTAYDTLTTVLANCVNSLPIAEIDDQAKAKLQAATIPGAQAFFSRPWSIIDNIARQNGLFAWVNSDGLHLRSFGGSTPLPTPDYAYGPPNLPGSYAPSGTKTGTVKKTLIGTPEQTQDGVMFRVLMDSTPKIGDVVQLAPGTLINPAALVYGGANLPPIPSQTGLYIIAGIRHVGDSRGEDWYTEITAVVQDFFASFLRANRPAGGQ